MEKGNVCEVFEIKSDFAQNTTIYGYASVFGIKDSHNDIIVNGAFASIKPEAVRLLWQHDATAPIGVIKSLIEDDYGLRMEAEINRNITQGQEAIELIKQKAIAGLSIGFRIEEFKYNDHGTRLLTKLDLVEISIVTFPAHRDANITNIKAFEEAALRSPLARLESLVYQLINFKYKEKI